DQLPPGEVEKLAKQAAENPHDFNLDAEQARRLGQLARGLRDRDLSDESKADLEKLLRQMRENPNVQRDDLDALRRMVPDRTPQPAAPPPGPGDPPVRPEPPPQPGPGDPPPHGPAKAEAAANDALADALIKIADWLQDFDPDNSSLSSA